MNPNDGLRQPTGDISLVLDSEAAQWCSHFTCSEVELRGAIAQVGPPPAAVRAYLDEYQSRPTPLLAAD